MAGGRGSSLALSVSMLVVYVLDKNMYPTARPFLKVI